MSEEIRREYADVLRDAIAHNCDYAGLRALLTSEDHLRAHIRRTQPATENDGIIFSDAEICYIWRKLNRTADEQDRWLAQQTLTLN